MTVEHAAGVASVVMPDPAIATLTGLPCPCCGERTLRSRGPQPGPISCGSCDASLEGVADVTVVSDRARRWGGCCAGFMRHELQWRDRDGQAGTTPFETWTQDRVRLGAGDRVSLLFPGDRRPSRSHPPMPLMVADHTTGDIWPLAGSVAVQTLRPGR